MAAKSPKPSASKVKPHVYVPDSSAGTDHNGDAPCTCRLAKRNTSHVLPDAPAAQAAHRARVGDRPEGDA